jgi:hypothetical protein
MIVMKSTYITKTSFEFGQYMARATEAQGEHTLKRTKGTKVKVLFQGLHMMCHFCVGL